MAAISLFRNISWTVVGNVVYAACQWGVLVVLAKLTSPAGVGQFALAVAIAGPVFAFANLSLRTVQATDARALTPFSDYLGLRVTTSSLAFLIVAAIALATIGDPASRSTVIVFGLAKLVESLSDCIYGLLQRREHMKWIAQSLILRGTSAVLLLATLVAVTGSIAWGVGGYVIAWAGVLLAFDRRHGRLVLRMETGSATLAPRFHWPAIRGLFLLALPLGLVVMLNTLSTNVPRYVIAAELGEESLGYFAAAAVFIVAGSTIVNAVAQASVARLARHRLDDRPRFLKLLAAMTAFAAGIGAAGIVIAWTIGDWVLRVAYAPSYADHADVLVWIMVAGAVLYVAATTGSGLSAARWFRGQAVATALSTAVILIASVFLVPAFGLTGGAIALLVGYGCKLLGQVLLFGFSLKERPGASPTAKGSGPSDD